MPLFHFHVRDGKSLPDDAGTELLNATVARQEAIRHASFLIAEAAYATEAAVDWTMEVTDERGLILYYLDFQVSSSAAATAAQAKVSSCVEA